MNRIIIHVDMDAFYASVEIRDNPSLKGKPLIIGSLPQERGVVATCSYEARKYGVRSGMNIKEAYLLCPNGLFMHPDFEKYRSVSAKLHEIWYSYASAAEAVSLDEAYLDVTEQAGDWEGARRIGHLIKDRTRRELGLTCSVGVAYSKTAAKTASEEKKPDGYFEIPTAEDFVNLLIDRDVGCLYTVGEKTAQKLKSYGIHTVRDLQERKEEVVRLLGKQGHLIVSLSHGIDDRKVTPYRPEDAKSISREITFQEDVEDFDFLKDVLILLSLSVIDRAERHGLHGGGVTLKITYADMKGITRSRLVTSCGFAYTVYEESAKLLDQIERRPVRLIGTGLYNLTEEENRQLSFEDILEENRQEKNRRMEDLLEGLRERYHLDSCGFPEEILRGEKLYRTIEYMRKSGKQ